MSSSAVANMIERFVSRPVRDETGLKGLFDLELQFVRQPLRVTPPIGQPDAALPDLSDQSIFTALQEQLGLKLESAKGPVEVLVIDSVQRPTEN
jgi:uncharacterized protein (TIGR03435 family)